MFLVKKVMVFLLIWGLSFYVLSAQTKKDVLYLKNGSKVEGVIIETIPNQSIKINTLGGNIFIYLLNEIEKTYQETMSEAELEWLKNNQNNNPAIKTLEKQKRSIWVGVGLSLFFPGTGQFYNQDYLWGGIQMGVGAIGYILFGVGLGEGGSETLFYVGMGVLGGTSIWSAVDAAIRINNHNKPIQEKIVKIRGFTFNEGENSDESTNFKYGIAPIFDQNRELDGLTLGLSYQF